MTRPLCQKDEATLSTTAVEPTKTRTTVVGDGETIGATAGAHGCTIRGSIMAVSEVVVTVGHESTMTVRSVELQRHSDGAMLAGMMTGRPPGGPSATVATTTSTAAHASAPPRTQTSGSTTSSSRCSTRSRRSFRASSRRRRRSTQQMMSRNAPNPRTPARMRWSWTAEGSLLNLRDRVDGHNTLTM